MNIIIENVGKLWPKMHVECTIELLMGAKWLSCCVYMHGGDAGECVCVCVCVSKGREESGAEMNRWERKGKKTCIYIYSVHEERLGNILNHEKPAATRDRPGPLTLAVSAQLWPPGDSQPSQFSINITPYVLSESRMYSCTLNLIQSGAICSCCTLLLSQTGPNIYTLNY